MRLLEHVNYIFSDLHCTMAYPGVSSARAPMSKVELRVECRKLLNKDITSKSDPCAVLFIHQGGKWTEVGLSTIWPQV